MTMTKQHFVALAQALKDTRPDPKVSKTPREDALVAGQWSAAVYAVADVCAASNAQFKRTAFYAACGLTEVA